MNTRYRVDPKFLTNLLVLLLYAGSLIVIMGYHEPWYDEAQAWLIARDATILELIGSITHYEGHPPIYFLILMPLAKLGVTFELGIKSVNFVFAVAAMGIFIFKAPFPPLIRYTIPFTYFFFYQHGVISRPYSMMMLGFVLSALFYKERNRKPFRFIASLAIVCGASAYGIVLVAGMCIIWLWEIVKQLKSDEKFAKLFLDRRFYALFILFIYNLLLLICLIPYPDTFGIQIEQEMSFPARLFFMLLIAPAEALCTNNIIGGMISFKLSIYSIGSVIIGIAISFVLFTFLKQNKKLSLWAIPYFALAVFGSLVYFTPHHIGVITMFYVFLLWCCLDDPPKKIELPNYFVKISASHGNNKMLHKCGSFLLAVLIIIPLYWSYCASKMDILYNYGTGREISSYINTFRLESKKIMVGWYKVSDPVTQKVTVDYNYFAGIPTLAYFDRNIFFNFNTGLNNKCYTSHKIDKTGAAMKTLNNHDYPDFLYGLVDLEFIYGSDLSIGNYKILKIFYGNTIWKNNIIEYPNRLYIRKDLLASYPSLYHSLAYENLNNAQTIYNAARAYLIDNPEVVEGYLTTAALDNSNILIAKKYLTTAPTTVEGRTYKLSLSNNDVTVSWNAETELAAENPIGTKPTIGETLIFPTP